MDFWRLWTHWCVRGWLSVNTYTRIVEVAFASIYTVCTLCDVTTLCIAQQDIWWQSLPTTAECEFWVWWVNIGSCHGLLNIVRLRPALQNTTWLQTREQGTKSEKHWTLQGPTHCGCVHTHNRPEASNERLLSCTIQCGIPIVQGERPTFTWPQDTWTPPQYSKPSNKGILVVTGKKISFKGELLWLPSPSSPAVSGHLYKGVHI